MNIVQILAGLIMINMIFMIASINSNQDAQTAVDEMIASVGQQVETTETNADQGQDFFMQDPTDGIMNWLETMTKFGTIFFYFITIIVAYSIFSNLTLQGSPNIIIAFGQLIFTIGILLINFLMLRAILELIRRG